MKTLSFLIIGLSLLFVGRVAKAGIANCDFCTFHLNPTTGTVTLNGTPTTTVTGSNYTATLHTNMGQAVQIYPDFDEPMNNLPVYGMNPSMTQAWITWSFVVGNGVITKTTPLAPN